MYGPESVSSRDGPMEPNRFMFCYVLLHWSGTAEEVVFKYFQIV